MERCAATGPGDHPWSYLFDDIFREAFNGVLLGREVAVVGEPVEEPRNGDRVGDPGLRLLPVTVEAEAVHADGLDLERLVGAPVLRAELPQPGDDSAQLIDLIIAEVHPSPSRAARRNAASEWPPT